MVAEAKPLRSAPSAQADDPGTTLLDKKRPWAHEHDDKDDIELALDPSRGDHCQADRRPSFFDRVDALIDWPAHVLHKFLHRLFARKQSAAVAKYAGPSLAHLATIHDRAALLTALDLPADHAGFSTEDAAVRAVQFGNNVMSLRKPPGLLVLTLNAAAHPFVLLLVVLATIGGATGDLKTLTVLLAVSVLAVAIRVVQEYRSSREATRLQAMTSTTATVRRRADATGEMRDVAINVTEIVVGDVLVLAAGDMFPGDAIVLEARDLFVTQAALTGESVPVEKVPRPRDATSLAVADVVPASAVERDEDVALLDRTTVGFAGTSVVSGMGTALVVSTGDQTYIAEMAAKLTEMPGLNAFERGVRRVSYILLCFTFIMAPLTIVINGLSTRDWGAAALFGLAVAVGLTPEMLPAIVNANLARGAMSMMRKKCIVKRLDAIQSMGGMQVLCTDKTGTLTEDRVAVFQCTDAAGAASQSALQYAYLNAKLQTGLRSLLDRAVVDEATTNASHIDAMERVLAEWTKVDEIPFDFARRLLTVVVDRHDHGERLMITKGAMEEVLAACEQIEGDEGEIRSLTHTDRHALLARSARMNTDGLRVLGLATKATNKQSGQFSPADEAGMTFRGFLAFLDPPKADARDAVQGLLAKGVAVKVLTGDNISVTLRVCEAVGIATEHVFTGAQLASMGPRQFAAACRRGTVFAKLSPFQKVDVVESLQKDAGMSVGFLGDGINDAMALKHADVGVSVDTGTIVAKESADVILLEKSLAVLLDAVVKGRRTAGNTLKYIKMTCAGNFSNTFSVLIAAAWLPYLPMSAVQLLTANIIYDISQISIPWDTMDPEYLEQPRQWIATDIARFMVCVGPLSSLTDVAIFSLNQYFFKYRGDEPTDVAQAQTTWYLWAVVMQMAVIPVLRTTKLPFIQSRPARPVAMTLAVMCVIGCSLPYIPAVASVLGMVPPPPSYWPWMALLIVAYMAMAQTIKHFYIRRFDAWI
ncbi:hypothetical protein GGF31_005955 [Allomyces arbusculus]|nr:hypothetical protein GGF31_005955 [Allomyces arbusculus]